MTDWYIQSQHPACRPSTDSKYSSNLARSRPPSGSPNSITCGLQVHLPTHSITASKCISKLSWLWPPSSHDHGLQVYTTKLTQLQPPSASPNSLDRGLKVCMIVTSKCISTLARSRWESASLSSPVRVLEVYLQIRSITGSQCLSKLARSRPRSVFLSWLDHHFQVHLALRSSTACSQSRYTMCRSVAIYIHRLEYKLNTWVLKILGR